MKELQKKYGHDREKLGQEMMKLYKETGTNPLSSCLPLLLQSPIFLALFRVLDYAAKGQWHSEIMKPYVNSLQHAKIFGAEISQTFVKANGDGSSNVKVVAIVLIILMTATMFTTQLQLMRKNMPKEALTGQAAQMQKVMLYVFPVFFLIGGFNFPIGVLIYWFVSNLWTMGQQFYVIRRNPAPGTPAYDAMEARKREHNRRAGRPENEGIGADAGTDTVVQDRRPAQRQQPKRQSRSDRRTGPVAGASTGASADAEQTPATSNGQASSNAQQSPAKKTQAGAAKKQPAGKKGTPKRQPAAKSAAQKRAAQKKPGGSR
jgi:YidC/Oxa1 family membrane protein insertase